MFNLAPHLYTDVPASIATCPECGGRLYAHCTEWEHLTNRPTEGGVEVRCVDDDEESLYFDHRWHQSVWLSVVGRVTEWARAEKG